MPLKVSAQRSLKMALSNLWRNKLLTFATVAVMGLILFIFNVIFMVNVLGNEAISELEAKVDMIFYLQENADQLVVNQLVQELDALPETTSVSYTSKDQALSDLLDKYAETGEVDPFESFDLENPLPASIHVTTVQAEDHDTVLGFIMQAHYDSVLLDIESNEENRQIIQNLLHITTFTKKLLMGIVVTFLLGSTMIIANAIHITIWGRKKELNIMKLVGAAPGFIKAPFLVEGALYGLLSAIIGVCLLMVFTESLSLENFSYINLNVRYLPLFLIQAVLSMLIGALSSFFATHYYLKHHARV
jgi:cell division transport system permease protein